MKSLWKGRVVVVFCLVMLVFQNGAALAQPDAPNAALSGTDLKSGLIDYWKADEASGDLLGAVAGKTFAVVDSVSNGAGKVYLTARQYGGHSTTGKHYRDNDDVRFEDVDFTVAAWWYQDESPLGQDPHMYHYIIQQNGADGGYGLGLSSGNQLFFLSARGENITDVLLSPPGSAVGIWHLVVCWFTAADHMLHMVVSNGIEYTVNGGARAIGANPVYIGADAGSDNTMKGRIGPIMMWNRALTSAERWSLWNSGSGLTYEAMSSASPAAQPTLSIVNSAPTVDLTWPHLAGNAGYEVWRSPQPYFDPANPGPGVAPLTYVLPPTSGSTAGCSDLPANPSSGDFYVVRGVNAAGATSTPSNRTGVFTFALLPGNS